MNRPLILIVDDEAELVSELAEWFELQGWRVQTASTGADALHMMAEGANATCLVTDRFMPSLDGDQLAERLSQLPERARPKMVAIMTGDHAAADGPRPAGADVVFLKPVDPAHMLSAISARLRALAPRGVVERPAPSLAGAM